MNIMMMTMMMPVLSPGVAGHFTDGAHVLRSAPGTEGEGHGHCGPASLWQRGLQEAVLLSPLPAHRWPDQTQVQFVILRNPTTVQ